jgi:hypothetical protein
MAGRAPARALRSDCIDSLEDDLEEDLSAQTFFCKKDAPPLNVHDLTLRERLGLLRPVLRVRKRSLVQFKAGADEYERQPRTAFLSPTHANAPQRGVSRRDRLSAQALGSGRLRRGDDAVHIGSRSLQG